MWLSGLHRISSDYGQNHILFMRYMKWSNVCYVAMVTWYWIDCRCQKSIGHDHGWSCKHETTSQIHKVNDNPSSLPFHILFSNKKRTSRSRLIISWWTPKSLYYPWVLTVYRLNKWTYYISNTACCICNPVVRSSANMIQYRRF